MIPKVM